MNGRRVKVADVSLFKPSCVFFFEQTTVSVFNRNEASSSELDDCIEVEKLNQDIFKLRNEKQMNALAREQGASFHYRFWGSI